MDRRARGWFCSSSTSSFPIRTGLWGEEKKKKKRGTDELLEYSVFLADYVAPGERGGSVV